ncbi:MAG: InlB B-repeat-containing protein [Solobacterium sp.]|nr:InlB B-repeat-containing protein [Solobacterium sp.]
MRKLRKSVVVTGLALLAAVGVGVGLRLRHGNDNEIIVKFNMNGGYCDKEGTTVFREKYTLKEGETGYRYPRRSHTLAYPDDKYAFVGWSSSRSNPNVIPTDTYNEVVMDTSKTLYAVWADGNQIIFDVGDGQFMNGTGQVKVRVAKDYALGNALAWPNMPSAAQEGYKCAGFALEPGGDPIISSDAELWAYVPSGDMTLYAIYGDIHTVTFHASGGSLYANRQLEAGTWNVADGSAVGIRILPVATNPDLAFAGWALSEQSQIPEVSYSGLASYIVNSDLDFYARYVETVRLTFHTSEGYLKNNGEQVDTLESKSPRGYEYAYVVDAFSDDPTKELLGWSYEEGGEAAITKSDICFAVFNEDTDLYAVWGSRRDAESISLETDHIDLGVGERYDLNPVILPDERAYETSSSDAEVAEVKDGTVIAKGMGSCEIRVFVTNSNGTVVSTTLQVDVTHNSLDCVFVESGGRRYWYENGEIQGTENDPNGVWADGVNRGREIYDPATDAWYWLDADSGGAAAANKEVWMPYEINGEESATGKWVRYDAYGRMIKGWYTVEGDQVALYPAQAGNEYYYDPVLGGMVKGWVEIDGVQHHFDEETGIYVE